MKETVVGFGDELSERVGRQVAIVAGRYTLVARVEPRVVLRLHDVTVDAGVGIVDEIRPALSVAEREQALADEYADRNDRGDGQRRVAAAPPGRSIGRPDWRRPLGHSRCGSTLHQQRRF